MDADDDDEQSEDYDEDVTNSSLQEEIERSGEDWFKMYTPKITTLAERLGFDADLMERPRDNLEVRQFRFNSQNYTL